MSATYIKGTCEYMCPVKEMKMREDQRLLHQFEIEVGTENNAYPRADPEKIVKKYYRSAAGRKQPEASDLRSPKALKKTVVYLLKRIVPLDNVDWSVVYNFVADGLCSVRQDLVIQDLGLKHTVDILEPIVRFHAYSGYRLCEDPIDKYDPVINFQHFTECLKKLLSLYEISVEKPEEMKHRVEMEALYLVAFLGKPEALARGLHLNKILRTTVVNSALEASLAYFLGNYVRACRKLKELPPLVQSAAALHLPEIRRKALSTMNTAFSSQNLVCPAAYLQNILLFEDIDMVINECKYYGISVQDSNIIFNKKSFNLHVPLRSPQRLRYIDEILKCTNIPDLLLREMSQ